MNYNIFSPKGRIDNSTFIIYNILLLVLYFVIGLLLFPFAHAHHINSIFVILFLFIINIFIMFNYKKRFLDVLNNLFWSCFLAFVLTFDHLLIPFVIARQNHILFYLAIIFVFCVQPIIVALLPAKKV